MILKFIKLKKDITHPIIKYGIIMHRALVSITLVAGSSISVVEDDETGDFSNDFSEDFYI